MNHPSTFASRFVLLPVTSKFGQPFGKLPRIRLNRPISARFYGALSFLISARILVSRLATRSRRRRGESSVRLRRNISTTCWVSLSESIKLVRSGRGGEAEERVRDGAECLG